MFSVLNHANPCYHFLCENYYSREKELSNKYSAQAHYGDIMANEKFILIDGSSMLVTNYYGNLPKALLFEKDPEKREKLYSQILHNDKGQYTNAMYGMMRTILKIIAEQKPTHMMFAFDMTRDTFRREKYPDYKGNRGDTPEPLKEQIVNMEKLLD